jgi:hypothetical protein
MADDDLEEGLRWDGEPDPVTPAKKSKAAEPAEVDPVAEAATGSVLLVVYGIIAGAYLLFTVGWVIAVGRISSGATTILAEIMFQFGEFLAIASPAVWFGATLLLTRHRKPTVRLLWLVVGLLVLAPIPFILGATS